MIQTHTIHVHGFDVRELQKVLEGFRDHGVTYAVRGWFFARKVEVYATADVLRHVLPKVDRWIEETADCRAW